MADELQNSGPLPARLQHFAFRSSEPSQLIPFYRDDLGFVVSDCVYDDAERVRTCFLRTDSEHHSLATFRAAEAQHDHLSFETTDWIKLRDWAGRISQPRAPIAWGGGRHGPGNDTFFMIRDPDGNLAEISAEPRRSALALPGPGGTRRYEMMMLPGENSDDLTEESRVRELLARFSDEDAKLEIVRKLVYHFHARIAERWAAGRIFLAGDAAYLSPSFAGQGMNSGTRDAHNLGWKLGLCVRGLLGPGALASYEPERKPRAAALIQMAVKMGHVMMPRSPANALLVQSAFRLLGLYRPARDYVMQMKYKPQPHFEHGLLAGDAGAGLRGRMLPQTLVELPDGTEVLLDQVLGQGSAVIEQDDSG